MHIVILADTLDKQYAGVYYYTRHLIDALLKNHPQHRYTLVRSQKGTENWDVEEIIVPLGSIPGHASFRLFFTIPKILNALNPDWVVEPSHFGPFRLKKSIKRATIIHDITPIKFPELHVWHSQKLQRTFLPGILKRDDVIITNSAYTKEDIISWQPSLLEKIEVIYAGKESIFQPTHKPEVLTQLGINGPFILYVGTIEPRKNLNVLLQAYEQLRTEYSNHTHQLVLCGKWGWKSDDLKRAVADSPYSHDIVHTGYIPRADIPVLMSACTVFVYPSLYEGFGMPVLEAMSCGAPTITSNVSSLPEVGGSAAHYVEPDDVQGLKDHMQTIISDPLLQKDLAERSLAQSQTFSWERSAQLFLKALEKYS